MAIIGWHTLRLDTSNPTAYPRSLPSISFPNPFSLTKAFPTKEIFQRMGKNYDIILPKLLWWWLAYHHTATSKQHGLHLVAKKDVHIYVYKDGFSKEDIFEETVICMVSGETLCCQMCDASHTTIAIWKNYQSWKQKGWYTQTSYKLWPNLAPVDRGSKKLVMEKVSWEFSEDLVRLARINLPPTAPFRRT